MNLEQQKKRARELLRGVRAGDADAILRLRREHSRWATVDDRTLRQMVALEDAQVVVAREQGFASWAKLGAERSIADDLYHSTAAGWAEHGGHGVVRDFLDRGVDDIRNRRSKACASGPAPLSSHPAAARASRPRPGLVTPGAWWLFGEPSGSARVRLYCFPYAGGGASIFRSWRRRMLPGIDVCPVQLPGREARIREAPFRRLEPLVDALVAAMRPHLERPYAFFGHSMGALVAHEAAQRLSGLGARLPRHIFVSGARAPDRMAGGRLHTLPDAEFAGALCELNGTPQEVLEHQELMELLMPTLRADFEVCETYEHREREPLASPITAFGGSRDLEVSSEDLLGWARMTRAAFESFVLPGDHFFLGSSSDEILRIIGART